MNIYLIERRGLAGYDEFDSAVVCANSEKDARMIHPSGNEWSGKEKDCYGSWVDSEKVEVTLIGVAINNPGPVICSSFNAG